MRPICCLVLLAAALMVPGCAKKTYHYIDGTPFEGRILRHENGRTYATLDGAQVSLPQGWISESPPSTPARNGGSRVHVFEDRVSIHHPEAERGDLGSIEELASYCNRVTGDGHRVIMVLCASGEWQQERREAVQRAWDRMARRESVAVISTCPHGGRGWLVR